MVKPPARSRWELLQYCLLHMVCMTLNPQQLAWGVGWGGITSVYRRGSQDSGMLGFCPKSHRYGKVAIRGQI